MESQTNMVVCPECGSPIPLPAFRKMHRGFGKIHIVPGGSIIVCPTCGSNVTGLVGAMFRDDVIDTRKILVPTLVIVFATLMWCLLGAP